MIGGNTLLRLRRQSPTGVWITAVAFAALVLILSLAVGVGEYDNGKQVGYLSALNWSLGFTVFTPLFLFFMLRTLGSIDRVIRRLDSNGMIVDEHYDEIPDGVERVQAAWELQLRRLGPVALAATAVAFVLVFASWLNESGGPLLIGTEPDANELDWSVAQMNDPRPGRELLNAGFSFLAYLQQAVFVSGLLLTAIVAYALTELLRSLVPAGAGTRLMPSPTSRDSRRGFQVFTDIPENILLAVAFAYGQLYLGRVWDAYQRAPDRTFQAFVLDGIQAGFSAGWSGVVPFLAGLLKPQVFSTIGILILIVTVLLGVVALTTVLITLRLVARDARELFVDHLDTLPPGGSYRGLDPAEVRQRMETMTLWPVRYPEPNQLIWLTLFAITVMYIYQLGFFYLGALLLLVIKRARLLDEVTEPRTPAPAPAGGG